MTNTSDSVCQVHVIISTFGMKFALSCTIVWTYKTLQYVKLSLLVPSWHFITINKTFKEHSELLTGGGGWVGDLTLRGSLKGIPPL